MHYVARHAGEGACKFICGRAQRSSSVSRVLVVLAAVVAVKLVLVVRDNAIGTGSRRGGGVGGGEGREGGAGTGRGGGERGGEGGRGGGGGGVGWARDLSGHTHI